MNYPRLPFLLLAALFSLSQCKQKSDPQPEDQLPAATQTGAGTFGCLVDGQAWTPKGNAGVANFRVTYDPGYHGGNLSIRAYRYPDKSNNFQYINMGGDRISQPGVYPLILNGDRDVSYTDYLRAAPCDYYGGQAPDITYMKGALTITKLDLSTGIIAGTFEFTLAKPGCDTVRVTKGRFDKKL